jgi:hypothetical protein
MIVRQRHEPKYLVRHVVSLPITLPLRKLLLAKACFVMSQKIRVFICWATGVGCMFVTQDAL